MVVREQKADGGGQTSMQSQWASMTVGSEEEGEDSSGSSDLHSIPECGQRKRKLVDETDDDKETKRRKNREAAKRCRDKKQKQTEDLKSKNGELEKENCQLAKQRDELIRKCKEYQREIDQHKQQGCVVPHFKFNPPYNLDHLLQPSSPPSPSFSESAPSTSSCPSPAPSVSPGPPTRYPPSACADVPLQPTLQEGMSSGGTSGHAPDLARGTRSNARSSMPMSEAPAMTQVSPDSNQLHYLRVRHKDGNHKILCLDHVNYIKVMHKLKAQRAAAAKTTQSEPMVTRTSVSTVTQSDQVYVQQEPEPPNIMNTDMTQSPFLSSQVEEQEASSKPGQKLDTCEDLLSILKQHVKDTGNGFELKPVSEDEVPIKQEPLDTEYEQNSFLNSDRQIGSTGIKQEDVVMPDTLKTWTSTGKHIRTGLDTLTNEGDPSSPSAHIQNIVQFLERDECSVPASGAQQPSQTARQNLTTQTQSARPAQIATYVTSSASVAALNKMNADNSQTPSVLQQGIRQQGSSQYTAQRQNGVQDTSRQQQKSVMSQMQTIKLRPSASAFATSTTMALEGKPQTASLVASSALASHNTIQGATGRSAVHASRTNATSSSSLTAGTQRKPVTNASLCAGSMETTQGNRNNMRMQMMPEQQLITPPSVQTLQQDSNVSLQHPASSTIDTPAIAHFHLQEANSTENLMSESSSLIAEYLKTHSIETLDS